MTCTPFQRLRAPAEPYQAYEEIAMGIISWIVFGLIAGILAKWIMPGDDPGGCIVTTILGVVGAFVGGYIGTLLGLGTVDGFNIGSFLLAIGGAILLLAIYRFATKKK
jgi:uncharacterized membrane protein YeaQ/YmgE (transglycosylase-associated protein family)